MKKDLKKDLGKQLKRASKVFKPSVAAFRIHAVEITKINIPPAYRRIMKHSAQMHFNMLAQCKGQAFERRKDIIRDKLKQAGYNTKSDKPYQDVLGIEGGRRAFNKMRPQ